MKSLLIFSVLIVSSGVILQCSGDESSSLISNTSTIVSTSLATARATIACDGNASGSDAATTSVPFACTPTNLDGRVFFIGALVGQDNSNGGENNKVMTFFANSDSVIENPSTQTTEGTLTFDLQSSAQVSGNISVPSSDSYPATPTIWRFESAFDYIDAAFTLINAGGSLSTGTHIIRTVFRVTAEASDVDDTMQVGDKLLYDSDSSKFLFCDGSNCTNTTRPASGNLQQQNIIDARDAVTDEGLPGNPDYAGYAIDIAEANQLAPSLDTVSDTTRLWTVDFDVTSAINFTSDISGLTTEQAMVDAFKLGLGVTCNSCTGDTGKIEGTLTIGDAGSAS